MSAPDTTEWATIGKIVAPFGLQGEVKVFLLSDIPNRFAQLKDIHVDPEHVVYKIKGVRPYKGDMLILKLVGVDDVNAAEKLRNHDFVIPMSKLAKLPPDSYYQHDILGLQVNTVGGRELGTIVDIIATGSNDVYVVKTKDGQQVLIPAIKEIIRQVDLIRHMMYIEPIGGLLDDNAVLDEQEDMAEEEVE